MLRLCAMSSHSARRLCARGLRLCSSESPEPSYSARALRIRREVFLLRQLRRLVVPGFLAYGLFLLRPHEGHFLRYLAERRHHDSDFNRLFPPPPDTHEAGWDASAPRGPEPQRSAATEGDAARLSRRRMLFSRERVYSQDDGCEVFRPVGAEARATQLEAQREAPPVYVLSEQLQGIMRESKAYAAEGASGGGGTGPPPVRLEFRDWFWFATGNVVFTERSGLAERRLWFVGVCGMIWREM